MILADLFGDDQHTATEDAYSRTMKCRKWVILASAAYFIVHQAAFEPIRFSVLVGEATVALKAFQTAALVGVIYIGFQYALLLIQLLGRYRRIISERFGLREIARMVEAEKALADLRDRRESMKGPIGTDLAMLTEADRRNSRNAIDVQIAEAEKTIREISLRERPTVLYVGCEVLIDFARLAAPAVALIAAGI